jgi:GNAT superfamily N-acetyltransferase
VALIVGSLDKAVHDRTAFDCGSPPLNDFLRTKAAKHQAQRVSRTFVLTDSAEPQCILGYYSLSNCQIAREALSEQEAKALPRHPIPAVMLARLAIDQGQQGKRYGRWLLMDAIKRTDRPAERRLCAGRRRQGRRRQALLRALRFRCHHRPANDAVSAAGHRLAVIARVKRFS